MFCPDDGARARHLRANMRIPEQTRDGVEYVRRRYGGDPAFIAYFQSFTNTNAPVEVLRDYYSQALDSADFAMIIVATRPDCLPSPVLDYLSELAESYELLVELGVQSANDATLARINRGHDFAAVQTATAKLAERGIPCAAHVILGLPGEGIREFRETADAISALPFCAVKIHNLLVLKGTPLAATFAERGSNEFSTAPSDLDPEAPMTMNEYEYADALLDFVSRLPKEWPLMRLTADAPPERIIAPKWWMTKGQFLEYFKKRLAGAGGVGTGDAESGVFMPEVETGDGSKTLYHPEFRQHFHSLSGAATEARLKFVEPCDIRGKLQTRQSIRVLDIGFGLGENVFATMDAASSIDGASLEMVSLELDERPLKASLALLRQNNPNPAAASPGPPASRRQPGTAGVPPASSSLLPHPDTQLNGVSFPYSVAHRVEILEFLLNTGRFEAPGVSLSIILGDARSSLTNVTGLFDAVYLDPFSHEVNPELWTYDFIRMIAAKLAPSGVVATYSSAFPVRGALVRAGLTVGETPAVGRKRGGTIASFDDGAVSDPLDSKTMRIISETTTGVPFRDPPLSWNAKRIRGYRAELVKRLAAKGIPKWLRNS